MYTRFVNELMNSIFKLISQYDSKLSTFAEHGTVCRSVQEIAFLRGDDAKLFIDIIHDNADIFGICKDEFVLTIPKSKLSMVKYSHSCYPKNVRRWLSGTLSRKKKCRVEFIVLIACWAIGWKRDMSMDADYVECRRELMHVCRGIFTDACDDCDGEGNESNTVSDKIKLSLLEVNTVNGLVEMLWEASQIAYMKVCKNRTTVTDSTI